MKKFIPLILVFIGVIGVISNIIFKNQPIILNERYINNTVLSLSEHYVDKILYTDKNHKYTTCICSMDEEYLMFLLLDNNDDYNYLYKSVFLIDSLSQEPDKILYDKVLQDNEVKKIKNNIYYKLAIENIDAKIAYNIFLNPTNDMVNINGVECEVKKIKIKTTKGEYDIGFWWYET